MEDVMQKHVSVFNRYELELPLPIVNEEITLITDTKVECLKFCIKDICV